MSEVRYSLNGKYFKDFEVQVSSSKGIADTLKRKAVNKYDWAEHHGNSVDLSKPKFESREIELKCFIVGDNWQNLFDKFNSMIRDEFSKAGTQRLLIEPFGHKSLPYEVYMSDDVSVEKTFRDGKMVGIFTLKMIEPNPIKKVLYFTGDKLNLSYDCPTETEIFYGNGLKETAKGNVSLSNKTLANRVVSEYNFEGRNMLAKGNLEMGAYQISDGNPLWSNKYIRTKQHIVIEPKTSYKWKVFKTIGIWSVVFLYFNELGWYIGFEKADEESITTTPSNARYVHLNIYDNPEDTKVLDINYINTNINFKLKKGTSTQLFSYAPEDEKIIIIAGNVEEITDLTTNATILWEKL